MHQFIGVFGNNNWQSTRTKHSKQILQMFSFFFEDSIKLNPFKLLATAIWLSEKIFYYTAKVYHWENLVDFLNGNQYLICFIVR